MARKYELKRRAERMAETRRRITEAAVELHGTVGPARTTIAAVAERAGVERLTVYRHFPDEAALLTACSGHWAAEHPLPDVEPLLALPPGERVRAVLAAIYGWYRGGEQMLANALRDAELVPALAPIVEASRSRIRELGDTLAAGLEDGEARRPMIAVALDFHAWRVLAREAGLADEAIAALMARAIEAAAGAREPPRPA